MTTNTAADFLSTLFSELDNEGAYVYLWAKHPNGGSRTVRWEGSIPDDLASHDIYFHCASHALITRGRGSEQSARAITCVWMDLDHAEGGHDAKKNYPPRADLDRILAGLPLAPSIVVNSGGGYHAYWLLSEVFEIEDDADRAKASRLVLGWTNFVAGKLVEAGFECDSTYDLARVLRVPGTLNHKYDPPREVVAIEFEPGRRYHVSDLEEWGVDERPGRPGSEQLTLSPEERRLDDGLEIRPEGRDHLAVVTLLCEQDAEFYRVWTRGVTDWSDDQSRYDLAIATRLAQKGATKQAIIDAMVEHRIRSGVNVGKIGTNVQYFARTLAKATRDQERARALARVSDIANGDESASGDPAEAPEIERDAKLDEVSKILRVRVDRIERVPSESGNGTYTLVTEHGSMGPMPMGTLVNLNAFRSFALDRFSVALPRDKPFREAWPDIVFLMRQCAIDVAAEGSTLREQGVELLEAYLAECQPREWDEEYSRATGMPFIWQAEVHVRLRHLKAWATRTGYARSVPTEWLRAAGCELRDNVRPGGKGTRSLRAWRVGKSARVPSREGAFFQNENRNSGRRTDGPESK